jgi:ketopantoate reductase
MDSPAKIPPAIKPQRTWAARLRRWLLIGLGAIVVLFAAYLWFALTWSYSDGERAGYVQKFSKKGVIVKTWEGELTMVVLPGTTAEKFLFTVRDDAVAAQVNQTLGKRVALSYEEHVGVPTNLFGETGYFVTGVRTID